MAPSADTPLVAVLSDAPDAAARWAELSAEAGTRSRLGRSVPELAPLADACAVVVEAPVRCGGAEEAVRQLRAAGAEMIAVVGPTPDCRLATRLGALGVRECFPLPREREALTGWLAEQAERWDQARRASSLAARQRERYDFSALAGRSPELLRALEQAARVVPRERATVLITGETGTGKELLARAIHYNGPRAKHPWVEVNCTAVPETLLEAELFGYEKGAFTDARSAKPGLFEVAHGGTLFLDEIGDMSLALQAKLLRVLEAKRVRRLGSTRSQDLDVRLLAATHVDLPAAVEAGRFREDLFYRLNVVALHLPPLRERGDDVLLLAELFLDRLSAEHGVPRPPLSPELRRALRAHPWPGNVRELRNAVERALLLSGHELEAEQLLPSAAARARDSSRAAAASPLPFPAPLDAIERAAAQAMLARFGGNKTSAADALGISRVRLYRLLKEEPAV